MVPERAPRSRPERVGNAAARWERWLRWRVAGEPHLPLDPASAAPVPPGSLAPPELGQPLFPVDEWVPPAVSRNRWTEPAVATIGVLFPPPETGLPADAYLAPTQRTEPAAQKPTRPATGGRSEGLRRNPVLDLLRLLLPALLPPPPGGGDELLVPEPLYGFQRQGIVWLVDHPVALLADEMGLGKTIQVIMALRLLVRRGEVLRTLVVCPKSVLTSWRRHLLTWAPELRALAIEGPAELRRMQWQALAPVHHVVATSYDSLWRDAPLAQRLTVDLIVADEVQRIKHREALAAQVLCRLTAPRRWGLTGTPLENRLEDVVNIFRFVRPQLFAGGPPPGPRAVRRAIEPYVLRRRKQDVLPDLPPKRKSVRFVTLTGAQREAYERAEQQGTIELAYGEQVTVQHVLALITRLKQLCNFHPTTGESAKLEWLRDHLAEAAAAGTKVLVFSQFVQTLRRLEQALVPWHPLVYTGELSVAAREATIAEFTRRRRNRVLLVSLRAGGVGLTLTAASDVVHYDSWWNPAVRLQAEDRAHRIGQTQPVLSTTLLAEDTIEERIEDLLTRKQLLFQRVVEGVSDPQLASLLTEEELFALFGLRPRRG